MTTTPPLSRSPDGFGTDVDARSLRIESVLLDAASRRVCRATRSEDGLRVVTKSLRHADDPAAAAAAIRHEFDIARRVTSEHVAHVLGIEIDDEQVTLVVEDFGGESLDRILARGPLALIDVLRIGVQIAEGLADVHASDIIHKDINPSNLVYNPETGLAKIIDFGMSSYLTREQAEMCAPSTLQGSLPYLSPEQTGRMNRALDYRTDFYSLGATLYELVTGRPMFDVDEPMEWLHCHIARQPSAPHVVNGDVPTVVSGIVMKLLAKNAEQRYRSARGIRADLVRVLEGLEARGTVGDFALGRDDPPQRFEIPQRLYGRGASIEQLMDSYERARCGRAELVLVSGYSGIGKTSLIKELYRPITRRHGDFVSGKFDQLHRNMPLSAPVSALRNLVRQILTEPEAELVRWRATILDALNGNGRIILDLLPDLELIIGPQPEVAALPRASAERRFHRTLRNFIGAFCGPEHPLVLFIDDLQWADAATLNLLELLLVEAPLDHLLIIGAFRSNEVQDGHPLLLSVERIRGDVRVNDIELTPLDHHHLVELLADALQADEAALGGLATLVREKTAGNPYFTEEFLRDLYQRDLIGFDHSAGRWRWDEAGIAATQMTDNVLDLMAAKLARLSEATRAALQVASCIGHRFDARVLAAVCDRPWRELADALREAMAQTLIAPLGVQVHALDLGPGAAYRQRLEFVFTHDRIQQTAHALLESTAREQVHLRIGRLLIDRLNDEQRDAYLFQITDHLNAARNLVEDVDEKRALRDYNLAAGRRARESTAYHAADQYLSIAAELVTPQAWSDERQTALGIHGEAADSAVMSGRFAHADELLAIALDRAVTPLQVNRLNQVKLASLIAQGLHTRALVLAKALLAKEGIRYPARPTRAHVLWHFARLLWRTRHLTMADLRALPEVPGDEAGALLGVSERLGNAAQLAQPELLPLLACRGVDSALRRGVTERSAAVFAGVSVLLGTSLGRTDAARRFADFAVELTERYPESPSRGRILMQDAAFRQPWSEPVETLLEALSRAFEACVECADWDGAAQAANYWSSYALICGMPLEEAESAIDGWRTAVAGLNQVEASQYMDATLQQARNLLGEAEDPGHLRGSSYDIDRMLPEHQRTASRRMLTAALAREAMLKYTFGEVEAAVTCLDPIRAHVRSFEHIFDGMIVHFYDALARLGACGRTRRGRRRLLRQVRASLRVLRRWAARAPQNALAKVQIVEAEWQRVRGRPWRAQALYDRAIATAQASPGGLPDLALANRLAGEMHAGDGRRTLANAYLGAARDAYRRWGARAVVDHLEARFPAIANGIADGRHRRSRSGSTTETMLGEVDLTALLKSLKAIAEERVFSRMVRTIITTAMEFAGAQHGVLLLRNAGGELCIEAEATVDAGDPQILQSLPVRPDSPLSQTVVNLVGRTRQAVVVHDAQDSSGAVPGLSQDLHVCTGDVRSILCLPIVAAAEDSGNLIGMLYLENNRATHTFTEARFDTLEIIGVAAAGRLELSRKAAVDGLTGLFNRDYFESMLHQELVASQRHGRALSLILADIDHFKRFNDTWGHQLGDEVLRTVAGALRDSCRESDVVARYGGEELAVILPDSDVDHAAEVAERIRLAVEAVRVRHEQESLAVTVSLGVAGLADRMKNEADLLRSADAALYDAKHAGRNRVHVA